VGAVRPKCVRAPSVAGRPPLPNMTGAGIGPGDRLLARIAAARDVSGLHRLPEMSTWPGVIGVCREADGGMFVRLVEAWGLPGLPGGGTFGFGLCVLLSHRPSVGGGPDVVVMVLAVKSIRRVSHRLATAWQRACDLSVFRAGARKRIRFVLGLRQ